MCSPMGVKEGILESVEIAPNPKPHLRSAHLTNPHDETHLHQHAFQVRSDPSTLNPQPSTLNPQPSTLNLKSSTLNPQPSTLNPQPSTLNRAPSTLNPEPSTVYHITKPCPINTPASFNDREPSHELEDSAHCTLPEPSHSKPSTLNPAPSTLKSGS
jgi:hypothetical protein